MRYDINNKSIPENRTECTHTNCRNCYFYDFNRCINCLNRKGKGCKNNFTNVCNGCKIYIGHTDKPNIYEE